ncbi:hypothetical protein CTI12_AA028950 [Artemisia annua]|uniref:Uncharacterized protein n=1 Tax=Artemisia annua TaxID=35608 RepID=A0A2U1QHN3_ARTAN|nr:hypothetical protein CTI12_AA028950 [Artemisia annua]
MGCIVGREEGLFAWLKELTSRDADQMWNTLAGIIKDAAKDSLGMASGSARTQTTRRESWWFNEEGLGRREVQVAKREAKKAVAQAKDKAHEDLYKKLDSKEGANDIFRIAKAREKIKRDIGNIKYIKDEGVRTIVNEGDIRKRWREYFSSLFNKRSTEGNSRLSVA